MRFEKQIAVLSDIHGNSLALNAVIKDINNKEIPTIVNLGDSIYGPLDPAGTTEILINFKIPSICGNEDRILLNPSDEDLKNCPSLSYVQGLINSETIKWLNKLPKIIEYENMILFHGTPNNDSEYFIEKIDKNGVSIKNIDDLEEQTSSIDKDIILCGHSHVPRSIYLKNGKLIVNPGSVGLPAYTDSTPFLHVMETGTPHARYSIVSKHKDQWWIEDVSVPYDWNKAASIAAMNGRLDWAKWLKYGRI